MGSGSMKQAGNHIRWRGVAVVEMAIVLPILVLLLLGAIDLAMRFYVRHSMVNAAREAARTMAVREGTADQAKAVAAAELDGIHATFTVTPTFDGGTDLVSVRISAPMSQVSLGIIASSDANMVVQTVMRKEE
jgi:Flp pilus assembly protein TadG